MANNEIAYTKITSQLEEIGKLLSEYVSFDAIVFSSTCHYEEEAVILPVGEDKKRFFLKHLHRKSILYTVSESGHPNIINHVEDSFIYHEESDNPLGHPVQSIAALPCYFSDQPHVFGVIMLYKLKGTEGFFQKELLEVTHQKLLEGLNQNQKVLKKLLSSAGIRTTKVETAEQKKNEIQRANQFFSSVIHDIRTPMNAVMGFLELLQEEATPKQREYLTAAHRSSEMVVALINDVLDVNKLSMGKVDLNEHFFSLMDEVENTALLFYHSAVKKEIDFIFYFDPNIPYVIKSDPFRIKQILNNLLSNAIKFTPKGGQVIMEFAYEETNDTLIARVIDSGIGISESAQKSIFQPFTQEDSETSGKYGGTGLGLSISKQLAELLGGGLFLKSTKDKGSEFSIAIPCNAIYGTPPSLNITEDEIPMVYLIEGQKSKHRYIKYFSKYFQQMNLPHKAISIEEALQNSDEMAIYLGIRIDYESDAFNKLLKQRAERLIILETELFSDMQNIPKSTVVLEMPIFPKKLFSTIASIHKGEHQEQKPDKEPERSKHILIVDDNLINLKLTQEVIRRFGFTSESAKDGQEAVEKFKSSDIPFDIIVIDKNMPILSGSEAIKQIRTLPGGDLPSIYGLTGDADEETTREMIDAGADEILHKPIKIEKIREIIKQ